MAANRGSPPVSLSHAAYPTRSRRRAQVAIRRASDSDYSTGNAAMNLPWTNAGLPAVSFSAGVVARESGEGDIAPAVELIGMDHVLGGALAVRFFFFQQLADDLGLEGR